MVRLACTNYGSRLIGACRMAAARSLDDLVPEEETILVRAADAAAGDGYRAAVQRIREAGAATADAALRTTSSPSRSPCSWSSTASADDALGGSCCLVVAAVALLFTRDAPFVAPIVVGLTLSAIRSDSDAVLDSDAPFLVILFTPWCMGTYNERTRAIMGLGLYEFVGIWANIQFAETPGDYVWIGLFIGSRVGDGLHPQPDRRLTLASSRSACVSSVSISRGRPSGRSPRSGSGSPASPRRDRPLGLGHDRPGGAVRRLLLPEQEKERQALETVEADRMEALTEMRRLVGLLREKGAMPEFAPQPGMATIDSLLDGVRAAGLPVELEIDGDPRELPPGVDLAAYRVVQGKHERAQVRRAGACLGGRALARGRAPARGRERRSQRRRRHGRRAAWRACANGSRCTAARSRAGRETGVATSRARLPLEEVAA